MNQELWSGVDDYLGGLLTTSDPALEAALADSAAAGLPPISVAPNQGKFLALLARARGARRILEIGTLGGYSTIWLARALPAGGSLVSLELEERHAEVARANLDRAGVGAVAEVRVGPAVESMERLIEEGGPPFDFVFIDADKEGYPRYFELAMRLVAPGSLIVADNVVRNGEVADAASADERVRGVRRFLESVAEEPRVEATAIQTVGAKGYDGFALIVVR
jgi:predicted O-methyltransferase YrrM